MIDAEGCMRPQMWIDFPQADRRAKILDRSAAVVQVRTVYMHVWQRLLSLSAVQASNH